MNFLKSVPLASKALGLCLVLAIAGYPPSLTANGNQNLPLLGDTASGTVSLEQEHQLGRTWLKALRSQTQEIHDPLIYNYVEHLLYRLAEHSQLQDRRLELVLVNNPELNAFAVPGGVVGVNGGLFLHAHDEQEFASVLAHELAHLSQRHYSRAVEAAQQQQLPGMAALLAGLIVAATVGGDAGMAAISATQAAMLEKQLRFSRENEQEADRIGLRTMVNSGMDPQAMSRMFERMLVTQRLAGSRPPEFLLTHPVTESRVADARSRANQLPHPAGTASDGDGLEYQLARNRIRLIFAENPAFAIKTFKSELAQDKPITAKAARYGLALAYSKAGQDSQAQQTLAPLLEAEPGRISYLVAYAEIHNSPAEQAQVEALLRKHLALNPDNYALSMALVQSLILQQNYAAAVARLEKLSQQRPNDPAVWFRLAEAHGQNGNSVGVHLASAEYFILTGNMDGALQQLEYAHLKSDKNYQLTTKIKQRRADIKAYQQALEQF